MSGCHYTDFSINYITIQLYFKDRLCLEKCYLLEKKYIYIFHFVT